MLSNSLAFSLHQLTARMDSAADRILRDQLGITYPRFLALFAVDLLGAPSQRELAGWLGLSEPSVSRTLPLLEADGYLRAAATLGSGNRRAVTLTPPGRTVVRRGRTLLERRFARVVEASGVDNTLFLGQVQSVLAQLGPTGSP